MRSLKLFNSIIVILIAAGLTACSNTPTKSPDVSDNIRKSLDQANLKDVSVSQDRDKGVVTLTGNVASDSDKAQAWRTRDRFDLDLFCRAAHNNLCRGGTPWPPVSLSHDGRPRSAAPTVVPML